MDMENIHVTETWRRYAYIVEHEKSVMQKRHTKRKKANMKLLTSKTQKSKTQDKMKEQQKLFYETKIL